MPAGRCLAHLVATHTPIDDGLADLARVVADFHASAARSPEIDTRGARDGLASRWESNFTGTRALVGTTCDVDVCAEVCDLARRCLVSAWVMAGPEGVDDLPRQAVRASAP
jgi:aminoglycoside phosphotransferase family enzyme